MSFVHSPKIVTNGLVLALDAGNTKSYPGSGTTWYDKSGNGNHLTFSSTPTMTGGVFNSAGTVYAYRNYIPVNSATNGYAMEVTFKLNSSTGTSWQNIIQNGNPADADKRHMAWYNGTSNSLLALFHIPNSYNNITDTLSTGSWYYLQMSYNPAGGGSTGRRAWLNGVEKTVNNTASGDKNITSGYFTVSSDTPLGTNQSNMTYSTIRYYNRYLTPDEIQQNFNALRGRYGI
jgi:hypothetical protein